MQINSYLQEIILQSIATAMNGDMVMKLYDGDVPDSAYDSIGSSTVLRVVSSSGTGTGMSFEDELSSNMLVKNTGEEWYGENVGSGTPTYYRLQLIDDDGSEGYEGPRIQGTVGKLDADLILASTTLISGVTDSSIGIYAVGLPTSDS
jgi:hypothetical protein